MNYDKVMDKLKSMANPKNVEVMARFGISPESNLGISVSDLRKLAKEVGKDHNLALELWHSGVRDACMLACLIDDPKKVSEKQLDVWVRDFNSWDVCDTCCGSLFDKVDFAYDKAFEWSSCNEEFVKRAGFALMAWLALHDKKSSDEKFVEFLSVIKRESVDDRNYVKKAVNWSLRQIGKRNVSLNKMAVDVAFDLQKSEYKSARWVGSDAFRELSSDKVRERLLGRKTEVA